MPPIEGKSATEVATADFPTSGENGLAIRDAQPLGHHRPSDASKQMQDNKLEPVERDTERSNPDADNLHPKEGTSEELPSVSEQGKATDKPSTESSQSDDNAMEENFLKMMLGYYSGDINTTIDLQSQLVALIPDNRSDKPSRLNDLSISYQTRFERFGQVEDIENSIDCLKKAIALLPANHPGQPVCFNNLGSAYRNRYERLGSLEDLEKAVVYQNRALSLVPDTHSDKFSWFNNIGNTYQRRFERLGKLDDLQAAINFKTKAVTLTPDGHANKPTFLCNLGSSLKCRFERQGELGDIHQAIEYQTKAVDLTADESEDKPVWLNNLGTSYQRRFERSSQVEDIEKAIECQLKAVSLTPEGYADRPIWMSNLGILYQHRYSVLGDAEDITRSIDYQAQALSLCPDDHYKRSSINLNLGNSLYRRFERFGKVADIDKAIEHLNVAISALPVGHADRLIWLNNLGGLYASRFSLFDEDGDMVKATNCLIKAFALTPDDHPSKSEIQVNLAKSYLARTRREPELVDIAIGCLKNAISRTPDGHKARSGYIQQLGYAHQIRYQSSQNAKDLDEAIYHQSTAVALVPNTFILKANWLCDLGQTYHHRFGRSGNLEDLNKAMEYYNVAISNTPDDHAYRPVLFYHLARAYEARFLKCDTQEDLNACISWFQRASHTTQSQNRPAFLAARKWAELSSKHDLPCTQAAYEQTMELMPQLLWFGSTVEQRYNELKTMGGVALEAASYAISAKAYGLALEWLEQGRSIVWNQILQLRTPFDDLATVDEDLANELQAVGRNLEGAGSRTANLISSTEEFEMLDMKRDAQRHRELASEWDRLLTKARNIPGFAEFLRPKRKEDLININKNGPVIVINVGETQGDALILLPNALDIAHIPLNEISRSKAFILRSQFHPLLRDQGLISRGTRGIKRLGYNPRAMFAKLLASLWVDIVEPVLSFLGIKGNPSDQPLPHLTWCTTGDLAGLPLHAAGLYDGSQPGAFDLVISSYTPTVGALSAPLPDPSKCVSGILAVGQENTPGFSRIANTVAEVDLIRERFEATSSPYLVLEDDRATIKEVLAGMEQHSWIHFACHASQNSGDPTNSSFHLHDGNLKLSTITHQSFKNKGLAFLSACQTATGAEDLPDEAVHLAAGLLMGGYPSVIATLWSVHDADAPEIARDVYAEIVTKEGLDHTRAARALHAAVQKLRMKVGDDLFERWIPFIHLGT